ncbi:hypothetical protein ACS0TY_029905 [Phlomoides rotata]
MVEEKMIPRPEMAESTNAASAIAAVNSKSEDSIPNGRSESPSSLTKKTNTATVPGKSCKGCLYYSSDFQANSRNPLCVGLSRSLPNVPKYMTEDSYDEGRSLVDFKYGCVGYSLYKDRKGQASDGQQTRSELPVCVGLEVLVDKKKASDSASVPSHIPNKEDGNKLPQYHRSPKPTNATGEEFLSRFTRNANLVANGVVKNMRRVGNQIKQSLDDILFPYRRRPK